jgi:histidyl-tRNA synthetase
MVLLLEAQAKTDASALDAYVVHAGAKAAPLARRAAETLRDRGANVVVHAGGGNFRAQMKRADASGARFAIIVGDDEAAAGTVAIKPLREGAEQIAIPVADLAARFAALQSR